MIRQKKHEEENFMTDIIRQFTNRNNSPSLSAKVKGIAFQIIGMASLRPLLAGVSTGPSRGNTNQNTDEPNIC